MNHDIKFRAECDADAGKLLVLIPGLTGRAHGCVTNWRIVPYRGCEVTLRTDLSVDSLRSLMASVPDGHVMAETVALAAEYTGERQTQRRHVQV